MLLLTFTDYTIMTSFEGGEGAHKLGANKNNREHVYMYHLVKKRNNRRVGAF
jgi:hypothetical protein